MEIFKSIFDSKITTNNERIKFLWDLIVDYWGEINSVGYLRNYLENNCMRIKLGIDYEIFMSNYSLIKFKQENNMQLINDFFPNLSNLSEANSKNKITKENLTYKDLFFLEIIFNELNFKIEKVKNEQSGRKAELFINLPNIIIELISTLNFSFVPLKNNSLEINFSFQKLISNKNLEIINIISDKNNKIKDIITEYLLIKTKKDINTKIKILNEFYKFIDKQKIRIENEFGKDIKNKIFSEMNNLNIRHDNQMKIKNKEGEYLYEFFDKNGKKYCELNKNQYIKKLDKLFALVALISNFLDLEFSNIV